VSAGGLLRNPWDMAYVASVPEPSGVALAAVGAVARLGYGR
jgi:hypothetical protein